MRATKQLSMGFLTLGILGTVLLGSYNSVMVNNDAFMNKTSGIKFTKRLDEINGKVVIGRMAASSTPWTGLNKRVETVVPSKKKVKKEVMKEEVKVATTTTLPAPAINADLELSLTNVFDKKPLAAGSFSGSAKTVDGVIEEIYVSLPNGKQIEINTRERMMGNVFQYEDSETREMKSAMFYEVKKGTYMVTLTNDSQFAGTRLEFKANEAEVAYSDDYYTAQESWDMDNKEQENKEEEINNAVASQVSEEINNEVAPQEFQDSAEQVEYAQGEGEVSPSYGFNFQS